MPIIKASPGGGPETVGHLVDATEQRLLGSYRTERNRLSTNISWNTSSLTFDFELQGITRGSYIAIDDEILYVWSTDKVARQAVVDRGQQGTTATDHAAGVKVDVNPRFPRNIIRRSLKEEIASWPTDLFRIKQAQVPTLVGDRTFDLSGLAGFHHILQVYYRRGTFGSRWHQLRKFEVIRDLPIDEFPTGVGLRLFDGPTEAVDLQVTAAMPFVLDDFNDTVELEDDIGLSVSMFDLPVIGACWRMVATREVPRTFIEAQGDSRRAEEIAAGAASRMAREFERLREQRLNEEFSRLRSMYPYRMG